MVFKRRVLSLMAAMMLAATAVVGLTTSASAGTAGSAGYGKNYSWVDCDNFWVYTYIEGSVHWVRYLSYGEGAYYWAITPVSDYVFIYDPFPIRDDCGPYNMTRLFSLKNSSGQIVASNVSANGSESNAGCVAITVDPNQYSLSEGCNTGYFTFSYTHPAGYINYGGDVFPRYYAGGWVGSTGWVSLGG
jgi:hypothetical protein